MSRPKVYDLVGKTFERLLVLNREGSDSQHRSLWKCRCICGKELIIIGSSLVGGKTRSCGCIKIKSDAARNQVVRGYIKGAKTRGLLYELSLNDFVAITQKNCHYCGQKPINVYTARGGSIYTYNGIDRLDNTRGYVSGNCMPCCAVCNYMKTNFTVDKFLTKIKEIYLHSFNNERKEN
jgi:hypothetical protein